MPYCIKCTDFDCDIDGLISLNWSTRGSVQAIHNICTSRGDRGGSNLPKTGPGDTPDVPIDYVERGPNPSIAGSDVTIAASDGSAFVPGATTGSVSLTAYAFSQGGDKWLGSKCAGNIQASQSNIIKYGLYGSTFDNGKYFIIPTKNHSAQVTGDIGEEYYSLNVKCTTTSYNARLQGGATIPTEMETFIGGEFAYLGQPFGIEMPDLTPYVWFDDDAFTSYISGFNAQVDFPSPATVTYTFQFVLECD
jgi:hypothetical protein